MAFAVFLADVAMIVLAVVVAFGGVMLFSGLIAALVWLTR